MLLAVLIVRRMSVVLVLLLLVLLLELSAVIDVTPIAVSPICMGGSKRGIIGIGGVQLMLMALLLLE